MPRPAHQDAAKRILNGGVIAVRDDKMQQKIGLIVTFFLIVGAGIAAHSFGFLGLDDFLYVGKLIAGWTAYTALVAILYKGIEMLMPSILCAPTQDPTPPNA